MLRNFYLTIFGLFLTSVILEAQLALPPSGANQKSVITQYMGAHAHVTITYNSPDVTTPQGQSRKGKIWGQTVPYGMNNLNFGISSDENPSPWRAGANENTVIEFSHDMEIEGQPIGAGKYGFHVIPRENEPWTLIFSKNSGAWGSYFYQASEDALRVDVTPVASEYEEWLTFDFIDRQESECTVALKWELLSIPFTISVPNHQDLYVSYLKDKMVGNTGFNWALRDQAANYCLNNEVNLKEALEWAEATSVNSFIGQENATTLQTLGALQIKNGMTEKGIATMEKAANHTSASPMSTFQMGNALLTMGHKEAALKIWQINETKNGSIWPVNVGLAKGYSAMGDFSKAKTHASKALENAPNQPNKNYIQGLIDKLSKGEDIN